MLSLLTVSLTDALLLCVSYNERVCACVSLQYAVGCVCIHSTHTQGTPLTSAWCVVLTEETVLKTQPEKKIEGGKATHRTVLPPTSSFKFFS